MEDNLKISDNLKINIEFKTNIIITKDDIDDIMSTALEGGITYWCDRCSVVGRYLGEYASEQIARGGTLRLRDCETGELFFLSLTKFVKGLKMFLEDNVYRLPLVKEYDGLHLDCLDADDADQIIQYALFDEIVFG